MKEEVKEPICLGCRNLVWQGFLALCVNVIFDNSFFEEAIGLGEAMLEGKSEKELAVIELQQELRFEKSVTYNLMSIPYIVWKRKDVVKYYANAPKTPSECPFGFEPI